MARELLLNESGNHLLSGIIARLAEKAPTRAKCIFLNCEMRETASDAAVSPDIFAVVNPLFGKARSVPIDADWETVDLLISLGRNILGEATDRHVTVDLIIDEDGEFQVYRDDGPLRRLAGGDGMYRSRYLQYVELNSWLAHLNRLTEQDA